MEYNMEFDWNFIQKLIGRLTPQSNELNNMEIMEKIKINSFYKPYATNKVFICNMKEAENITKVAIDMTNSIINENK